MSARIIALSLLAIVARAAAPVVAPLGNYHAALAAPVRVAAAASGLVYVAEPDTGRIVAYDAFGRVSEVRSGFAGPLALAVDGSGRILVSETGTRSVSVFDAGWNLLFKLGGGDGEFASPGFLATGPPPGQDTVYVSDGAANRVGVYSNGTLAFTFGTAGAGPGQFDFPAGICATTNEIFVVDQNHDRLQVFDHSGAYLRAFSLVFTGGAGQLGGRAQGIQCDPQGRLYVSDAYQGLVKVFGPTGTLLATIGSLGDAPGQLRSPSDVALDPGGRLLVASPNNGRVELFGLDAYVHLTASPAGQTLAAGTNLALSVLAGGAGPFTYQWRFGTNELPGETNATLTLSNLTPALAGTYAVVVTGPLGSFSGGSAALAVMTPPSILVQPAGQVAAQGSNVLISVTAVGDALAYQWLLNGTPLVGATNAVLARNAAQAGDSGDYAVVVRNAVGEVESDPATLAVLAPPVILLQPSDQKVIQGNAAAFGVAAEGDQLSYSWKFNSGPVPAPDDPTMVMNNVQPPAAGFYSVVVTNPIGAVTSGVAQLSVFVPPGVQEVGDVELQPDNSLRVQLLGDTGYTFALDASPDLQDWQRLTNLTSQAGVFDYLDADATNVSNRFYRLRWRP